MLRLSQSITTSTEIRSPSHRHKFDSKFHPWKGRKQSLRQLMDMFRLFFRPPMFHLTDLGCSTFTSSEKFFAI